MTLCDELDLTNCPECGNVLGIQFVYNQHGFESIKTHCPRCEDARRTPEERAAHRAHQREVLNIKREIERRTFFGKDKEEV